MRVQAVPYVYASADRRERADDRRMGDSDRRRGGRRRQARARLTAHSWFTSAFGAHILGQSMTDPPCPARARAAYAAPETHAPPSPTIVWQA